jgi:phosphoribosylaminoimidazolecarboxamide formyltransferase/IMP cyclohydrolase
VGIEAAITQEGGSPPGGIPIRVGRALISVSDKTGIVDFARGLRELGVEILSTGGTAAAIREAGLEVIDVSEFTGSPEILDGRVKTLHPRLHAAVLARRDDTAHMATLEAEGIVPIDLVCVNLYPFQRTIEKPGVTEREAVENIDIGGPTMIRAAAKNHSGVAVVVKPEAYDAVLEELREFGGEISTETRQWLANEAFAHTASYDAAISRWFGSRYENFPDHFVMPHEKFMELPYGENPHQKAAFYVESDAGNHHVLARVSKHHGKPLSYNNILDLDAAWRLLDEFAEPACVIVKHNNPCGAAIAETAYEAYEGAFACDPLSAFGGVVLFNRPIDTPLAERLQQQFIEVLLAPTFEPGAMEVLTQKESTRILEADDLDYTPRDRDVKRVRGGLLVQEPDRIEETRETMTVPTQAQPSEGQWEDLLFAWKVCRHVRSNAIVFARGRATIGIGAGQMSRVDSVRIAIDKAREARPGDAQELLDGSAVASDAFYPFPDGPETAIRAGASALIQPGGSKRDDEVIAACDAAGAAMVLTGRRHFRH